MCAVFNNLNRKNTLHKSRRPQRCTHVRSSLLNSLVWVRGSGYYNNSGLHHQDVLTSGGCGCCFQSATSTDACSHCFAATERSDPLCCVTCPPTGQTSVQSHSLCRRRRRLQTLLAFSARFQLPSSSFASDWRLSLFSYKYICVSHIMFTRTASLTSSSNTSWDNWGLNLHKRTTKTTTSHLNGFSAWPGIADDWPVVDGISHFTPGCSSVHCTAIRVCALSKQPNETKKYYHYRLLCKRNISKTAYLITK